MSKFLAICILASNLFGAWVMFSDGQDTYIYNNLNGDIFIRHRGNGENYEDKFIKMSAGVVPQNQQNNKTTQNPTNRNNGTNSSVNPSIQNTQIQKEQVDALERRFQELESNLLNKALE